MGNCVHGADSPGVLPLNRHAGAAIAGYAAIALLVTAPAFFAAFPGYGDIEGGEGAVAHIRGTASTLEHTPLLFLGYPFVAMPPNMAYYPAARLADAIASPSATVQILAIFHIVCAGMGLYALACIALRTSPWPSFLAGAWFVTSGFFVSHREHAHILGAATWILWAVAGVALALRRHRPSGFLIAAVAIAMAFLAGHYQIALYGLVLAGLSALFFSPRPASIAYTAGAAILGMGLAAVLLFPSWSLLGQSSRMDVMAQEFDAWSFSPFDFIGFLIPGAFGGHHGMIFTRRYGGVWSFVETACYIGLVPLAICLAYLPARCRRDWRARWLLTVLALGLLLALGRYTPVYGVIRHIPGLNAFRAPGRWLFLVDFALALGAALAIDRWLIRVRSRTPLAAVIRTASFSTAAAVLFLIAFWGYGRTRGWTDEPRADIPRPWPVVLRNLSYSSHPFTPRLWIPLGLALLGWAVARRGPRIIGTVALADTLLFALAVGSRYPSEHPAGQVPGQAILEDAERRGWDPSTLRVLTDEDPNAYAYHGLASVTAMNAFVPENLHKAVPMTSFGTLRAWPPAKDMVRLGVSYVVSRGKCLGPVPASPLLEPVVPGYVYAVPSAQPLVRPSRSVICKPGYISATMPEGTPAEVEIAFRWEAGWQARADGMTIPLQARGAIMEASVPPGTRVLELIFENPARATGSLISAIAVAVLAIAAGAMAERRFLRRGS